MRLTERRARQIAEQLETARRQYRREIRTRAEILATHRRGIRVTPAGTIIDQHGRPA